MLKANTFEPNSVFVSYLLSLSTVNLLPHHVIFSYEPRKLPVSRVLTSHYRYMSVAAVSCLWLLLAARHVSFRALLHDFIHSSFLERTRLILLQFNCTDFEKKNYYYLTLSRHARSIHPDRNFIRLDINFFFYSFGDIMDKYGYSTINGC